MNEKEAIGIMRSELKNRGLSYDSVCAHRLAIKSLKNQRKRLEWRKRIVGFLGVAFFFVALALFSAVDVSSRMTAVWGIVSMCLSVGFSNMWCSYE